MLFAFARYTSAMVAAGLLGFTAVHYMVWGLFPWSQESKVTLKLAIRGSRNQPVSGAQIFIYTPEKKILGFSDAQGEYRGNLNLPRGQISVLEAVGPTYKIRKDLPIPRTRSYTALVRLDPKEAQLGNMTLISKALEEMGKNVGKTRRTTPVTEVPVATPKAEPEATKVEPSKPLQIIDSEERAQPFHRIAMLKEILTNETVAMHPTFATRGIATLKIRPLVSDDEAFYEIVGLDTAGKALSSVILKGFPLNQETVGNATRALLRNTSALPLDSGSLTVYTSRPGQTRAYLNGVALPRTIIDGAAQFQIVKIAFESSHGALAVTADERPLIRKVVLTRYLKRDIQWSLPEPSLSSR
jgi:hypothetical protein